eukprot:scaffold87717_cov64-Phaeocystis_antarctica.AAC.3
MPSCQPCRPVRKAALLGAHQVGARKAVRCTAREASASMAGVRMTGEPPKPVSAKPRSSSMSTTMCGACAGRRSHESAPWRPIWKVAARSGRCDGTRVPTPRQIEIGSSFGGREN